MGVGRAARGAIAGAVFLCLWALWVTFRVSTDVPSEPAPEERRVRVLRPPPPPPVPSVIPQLPTTQPASPPPSLLVGPDPFDALLEKGPLTADGRNEWRWEPLSWPDPASIPEGMRPERFRQILEGLPPDCTPGSSLVGVDCAEPPCFGIFATVGASFRPPTCPEWKRDLGGVIRKHEITVPCASGDMLVHLVAGSGKIDDFIPDPADRVVPRFSESLDLEALCRYHEASRLEER